MDKRWMYEEAMRMPFIVHCPKLVKKGSENNWLINNTDFAPTILELAGLKVPKYMQGRSFLGALKGEEKPEDWRKVTYYRYWMHLAHSLAVPAHFGIRSDRYKLIFFYGMDENGSNEKRTPVSWEFYDLKEDPWELHNVVDAGANSSVIAEMRLRLADWSVRTEDPRPVPLP